VKPCGQSTKNFAIRVEVPQPNEASQ